MSVLLVDDRDGRILAEVETQEAVQRLLEMLWGEEEVPDYLCLVETHSCHGPILGTDKTVKIRPLS